MENYTGNLDANIVEEMGYEAAMLYVRGKWSAIMEEDFDNTLTKMQNGTAYYPQPGKRNKKRRRHGTQADRYGYPNGPEDEARGWIGI